MESDQVQAQARVGEVTLVVARKDRIDACRCLPLWLTSDTYCAQCKGPRLAQNVVTVEFATPCAVASQSDKMVHFVTRWVHAGCHAAFERTFERNKAMAGRVLRVPKEVNTRTLCDLDLVAFLRVCRSACPMEPKSNVCAFCGLRGFSVRPLALCRGCGVTMYCGSSCQKSDWERHEEECEKVLRFAMSSLDCEGQ